MPRKYGKFSGMDLTLKENHEGYIALVKCPPIIGRDRLKDADRKRSNPSGSASSSVNNPSTTNATMVARRKQKAMAIAMKPGSQVAMNAFMMYMSGSNLNIFSINTTSSAILTPLTSLFQLDRIFGNLDVDASTAKMVYVAINLVWLGVGLYKMTAMRLLPTTSADFADSIVWKDMMETSSIPPVIA
mmetsp:Transcript_21487/g.51260  ORF Transcript_21487/g.51260 Transcript_21487/m.51260 type:complete len:187 (-) Transcript_21487:118-678(-)